MKLGEKLTAAGILLLCLSLIAARLPFDDGARFYALCFNWAAFIVGALLICVGLGRLMTFDR